MATPTSTPTTLAGLANYAPRTATVSAVQFTGQLDPGTAGALVPASTDPAVSGGTFLGLPTREEPFRHPTGAAAIAAASRPTTSPAHPLIETAVLVPTPAGGVPAFPGDWIVQHADGTYSVWTDQKFRAEFELVAGALDGSGSGTGRWGDAHDNWTFGSDGTDYPGSYGIGPDGLVRPTEPATAAAPTEPVAEAATPTEPTSPEGDILN